jgi:RimJ/RimL family protein N-acetyltransferase
VELLTKRLLLREFIWEDWTAVFTYQSNPLYLRYNPWTKRHEADVQAFVQMFIDYQSAQPRTKYQFAVVLWESGQLMGNCGVRKESAEAQIADMGYELDPNYWGKGYATEAATAVLNFGFAELKVHRIGANAVAENTASLRVLEKIGMQYEGRLRENKWMKDRWWDTVLYGILEHEWRQMHR